MELAYLKHADIDKIKWDGCIKKAKNTLIYAHSFYLDNCSGYQWDAIVLNDYEAVMPLIFRKKYGILYLYQPAFLQQAGIFYTEALSVKHISQFLESAAVHFNFIEINLNYDNKLVAFEGFNTSEANNFVLDISEGYERVSSKYKSNFRKNLKETTKHILQYRSTKDFTQTIDLFKQLYSKKITSIGNADYDNLKLNCNHLEKENDLVAREVVLNDTVYAAVILLKDANRLYNIVSCVTEQGRKLSANYLLFDSIIHEFAGQNLLLDLEGSDIKGIADFYKSMNPVNEMYPAIKYNNLPGIIKLFKK